MEVLDLLKVLLWVYSIASGNVTVKDIYKWRVDGQHIFLVVSVFT